MTRNWTKRLAAIIVALAMFAAIAPAVHADEPTYTFRDSMGGNPINWSPFTWMNANCSMILGWTNGFWGFWSFAEDGVSMEWFYQDADLITDITAEYWDLDRWDITEDWGRVWRIDLNPNVRWNTGTPVNAHDYVWSWMNLLDPRQQNTRAGGLAGSASQWLGAPEYQSGYGEWEDVSIYALDDYTLIWITTRPADRWTFLWEANSIFGGNLVYREAFEASQFWEEDVLLHTYGTTLESTFSWGPMMLASYEVDRQFSFVRNPYWHGWNDPRFEGQFPMTHLVIDIIDPGQTELRLMLFEQGELSITPLTADQAPRFRFSERLFITPGTATFRWIIASDLDSLIALEEEAGDGNNIRMLHYREFRRGISLAMDRALLVRETTAASQPFVFLLNDLYYYDIANNPNSVYRWHPEVMQLAVDFFGIEWGGEDDWFQTLDEAYDSITGFDVFAAREAFQLAFEQAVADGNMIPGQNVNIPVMLHSGASLSAADQRTEELMNDFIAEAIIGTGFEAGGVQFAFTSGSQTQFRDVAEGRVAMIRGAWQSEWARPWFMIGVYVNPDIFGGDLVSIHTSNGWDPTTETLTISNAQLGFSQGYTTKTYQDWHRAINGGMFDRADDPVLRLRATAALEFAILEGFRDIPIMFSATAGLLSYQVEWGTPHFNVVYTRGGLRRITFNFNDQQWAEFVASQGGILSYE
ncbi:MAG: ABC transporter substrate-binding protein [Defluviitaleaceae bacterium]|nr:ABC transporter substrate-binding protein [Defluviitaleaceae bacterium]